MILKALELAQAAGVDPKWLISREFGRSFLPFLEDQLAQLSDNQTLVIDFEEIRLLEWSFADEVFATLAVKMASGMFPRKYLALKGLSETSIENLQLALRTRPEREEKQIRNLIIPIYKNDKLSYIGKLEEHLKPVWDFILSQNQITARDLASENNLEINTASTKLKTLFDLRLLKREELKTEAGKQYIYSKI